MVATVIALHNDDTDALSVKKGVKCVVRKSNRTAKYVTRKSNKAAKATFGFAVGFGSFALKVLWYMLVINLMAMGFVALGLAAEWAIVPFFFLIWKGII